MESSRAEDSLGHFRKTLSLRSDFADAHESLGDALKRLERFDEAVPEFDRAGRKWSAAKALECLFAAGRYDELRERLAASAETDEDNIRIGALSAFAAQQLGHADPHRFCPKPLDFVREFRCHDDAAERGAFLDGLLAQLDSIEMEWQPPGKSTTKGFQSHSVLLHEPTGALAELNRILKDRIEAYRAAFVDEDCNFIRHWPRKWSLDAWSVSLVKGGRQAEHIHPDGWLSGVIYLRMP